MTLQPLSPAQALWQHYNAAPAVAPTLPRSNPVYHKDIYTRLQQLNRGVAHGQTKPATLGQSAAKWQPVTKRETELDGLGLSEL